MKPGPLEGLPRQLVPGLLYPDSPQSIDVLMCGFRNSRNPSTLMAALFFTMMARKILSIDGWFHLGISICLEIDASRFGGSSAYSQHSRYTLIIVL
ncbi:hypothetical protein RHMOL_Rhmol01G0182600 [Rhododendron molle]|uniref:Uncharacterized protein n=1 Tax=Rhododendron molle TaxID=49168 RepID=A0ACC0Q2H6_RHOML|nr:hypothetical protein RHMOL_Rhmol01G0182600 [Rhododendron molle]